MNYTIDPQKERQEILKRYRQLIEVWQTPGITVEKRKNVRKAFNLAVDAHKDMRRRSGEPYIYHPLEVATICARDLGLGETSIICALLHDVVEDTDYTVNDIEKLFNPNIAEIIDDLTKIDFFLDQSITYSKQAENFKKLLISMTKDIRVILIKLADRLHNMKTLDSMPPTTQLKISSETLSFYAPLAHRLGLYSIKSQLEDYALKYTEPAAYEEISKKIDFTQEERKTFINNFLQPIVKKLDDTSIKYRIETRLKSISSIWNKMNTKQIPFEDVYDLFAVRIILNVDFSLETQECFNVLNIVQELYIPNNQRYRNWIIIPKANGYQSLHTTVMSKEGKWVEIQIRTERMNDIAERGYAAHWKYKHNSSDGFFNQPSAIDNWITMINQLLKESESMDNPIALFDEFKLNLFSDEIFVFTPRGEQRTLPKNATVLDFAYAIHTELANRAIGAKVNHKLVALNQKLESGDQIEIISGEKEKVDISWIDFAITQRARNFIKKAVKTKRKTLYHLGENMLKGFFELYKIEYNNENIGQLRSDNNITSNIDLFYYIANGTIKQEDVKASFSKVIHKNHYQRFRDMFFGTKKKEPIKDIEAIKFQINDLIKQHPKDYILGDLENINIKAAPCCSPIPGDDVIGYINEFNNIETHRINCPNAILLMSKFGDRIVKLKWQTKERISVLSGISLTAIDRKGFLIDVVNIISSKHTLNIRSMNIESHDGIVEGTIMIYVQGVEELELLISDLKKLKPIKKIFRIERKITQNQP